MATEETKQQLKTDEKEHKTNYLVAEVVGVLEQNFDGASLRNISNRHQTPFIPLVRNSLEELINVFTHYLKVEEQIAQWKKWGEEQETNYNKVLEANSSLKKEMGKRIAILEREVTDAQLEMHKLKLEPKEITHHHKFDKDFLEVLK